jgi:hypothetical protein
VRAACGCRSGRMHDRYAGKRVLTRRLPAAGVWRSSGVGLTGLFCSPEMRGTWGLAPRSMGATRAYCRWRCGQVADLAVGCPSQSDSPIGPNGSLGSVSSLGWVRGPVVDCLGRGDARTCVPQRADPPDSSLLRSRLQADTPSLLACSWRHSRACSCSSTNRTLRPPSCNSAPAVRTTGDCPKGEAGDRGGGE